MIERILSQFRYFKADLRRWKVSSIKDVFYLFFEQGIWGTFIYRVGRALYLIEIPILRIIFRLIGFLLHKLAEIFLGVSIKPSAAIGPGLYIGHTGAIVIHPNARIGANCSLGTGVVIGERGAGQGGVPTIGDNVYIGVGAKILGAVKIGNNVKIGANAVVIQDVPDGATAVGVPARLV